MKITSFPADMLGSVVIRTDATSTGAEFCGDGVYLSFFRQHGTPDWRTEILTGVELTLAEAEHLRAVLARALREAEISV